MKVTTCLLLLSLVVASSCEKTPQLVDQQLVYLASRGNGFDIYKANQDGSNEMQLTTQPGWDWGPRWSEAFQGIMHYEQDTVGTFTHRLISAEGEAIEMDFHNLSDFIASPNGEYALYSKKVNEKDHIFMFTLSSGDSVDITPRDAYHGRPKWSPDGQQILMISDESGSQELHLFSLQDQRIQQITEGKGRAKYATWSPDGTKIALTREALEELKKDHDIFIFDLKTSKVTQLTNTPWGEQEISWSPMGDKIAYHGTIDGKDDIYTLDINTMEVVKITQSQGYHGEPDWIPIYR